ncbi:MAG: hypothetical protein PWQ12_1583 [Clostridiales bacterium]|jgi:membrane associated rhomboid family serine protease|nr:hypothetical protein [Clostridiales bacterium]
MKRFFGKFEYNAPVVLTFALVATVVYLVTSLFPGIRTTFFVYYGGARPIDILRLFLSTVGHVSWEHLLGNLSMILLIGPILEEKYSSKFLLLSMGVTTVLIGLTNSLLTGGGIIGASGIVFMMIIMISFTGGEDENDSKIPLTFILVALLYLSQQVYNGLFVQNNISELAHIVGGVSGVIMVHVYKYYWKK